MEKISTKNIRNVCLMGHSGAGKTSLAEAMLYIAHETDRLGRISEGNTVCDYDSEEIRRGSSVSAALATLTWEGTRIHILDTPGYFDFEGEVRQCARVADAAVIVVDGKAGVSVGTEQAWEIATEAGIPKSFFINRFDDGECRFHRAFGALRERFGVTVCPVQIPLIDGDKVIGFVNLIERVVYTFDSASGSYVRSEIPAAFAEVCEEYHTMLLESIAQTSEDLMEKFFAGEEISQAEAFEAIHTGIIHGDIVPVFCGAATKMWGIKTFMDTIAGSFPRPTARKTEKILLPTGETGTVPIQMEGPEVSLFVFRTVADPFVGKMSYFKVMEGTLHENDTLKNVRTGESEKLGHLYYMRGKKQIAAEELVCGDIAVTAKLGNVATGDTLTTRAEGFRYLPVQYPKPYACRAVRPLSKGDEDKISQGMARLLEEDPTIRFENNPQTKQLLLYGLGDTHLEIVVSKLKNRFGTGVELTAPRIAYRETIRRRVEAEGKHKKQSGGSGQYGHVKIRFSPGQEEGLTFTESVFGGAVPKNFFPAVEKGLLDAMAEGGVLAGYPMVRLAAELYDGSYHEVDSNEISFKLAARLAYREGLPKADPVILEPIGELRVVLPDGYVGDVLGDLNRRRGRVSGIEATEGKPGYQTIVAEVPQAEMGDYVTALRAMTQGRARFDYTFTRYEELPSSLTAKVISEAGGNAAG